ncbi:TetR/AcrR family transcriptional regulator [Loigolactobacillus backii]|uniref:Uncharacterized protein n=1 Tax=Loigolactobacillus backii TaxID=375175 RepID=A0A192H172_9LACO|nr:TetR/AcrR family transcriptional regulator [Loigolactobacillus backii]ANK60735.1 hypothetical protein AYR52_11025 [Loigolactobacillus backii]ANK61696.1 hypothetical protein AYR53_02300 [Loigolactobacillus backii]ANK65688.1 hypothetical protein AYR54_10825 [Loigolactobacillus backii]ANK68165.1 hypothetical protein AYR55_10980 [Loigolactobacillus backii]ANK69107.1 hypothetical protein AYR56_02415 [Loigolactobacillus backii]
MTAKPLEKRRLILKRALTLFAKKGYEVTTVPEIATAADVGVGTIYRYFKSKNAIFNELYQNIITTLTLALRKYYPVDGTAKMRFDAIYTTGIRLIRHHVQEVYFINNHVFNDALDQTSVTAREDLAHFIRQFILDGQADGTFKKSDPDVLISILYGSLIFTIEFLLSTRQLKNVDLEKIFAELQESCWDAFAKK